MEALRQWLLEIANCVESGSSEITFVHANVPREMCEEPDERQTVLATEALKSLPRPMQTLLKTLESLKVDITTELIKQRFNHDAAENACMESNAAFACKALQTTAKDIESIIAQGLKHFNDPALEKAVHAILQNSTGPSEWAHELSAVLRALLETQTSLLKETTSVKYTKRLSNPFDSKGPLEAIKHSSALRQRLEELSNGSMTSLYSPKPVNSTKHQELVAPVAVIESKKSENSLTECIESIRNIRSILRRVRLSLDGIVRSQAIDIDDCKKTLIIGLQRTRFTEQERTEKVPAEMAAVDSALQEEIRLLLQTISVDRSALDLALRNIKTKCAYLSQSARAEASMTRAILMKRLQMQLQDAFDIFVKSTVVY